MASIFFRIFLLIALLHGSITADGQIITTVAGTGVMGYSGDGDTAILSKIDHPIGLAIDNNGDLLLCNKNAIRKVNLLSNLISTVAGSDTASSAGGGGDGGPATCAQLVEPYAVCTDWDNNIFTADYWTNRVRWVNSVTKKINVYAGSTMGNSGDGGPATVAKFGSGITCVAMDTVRKRLYISDCWNYRVRYVDMTNGLIYAFAGSGISGFDGDGGPATAAKFSRVMGLAVNASGDVFIGDWDNRRIRKVNITTGIVSTIAGNGLATYSGDGGPATNAAISKPTAICFDICDNLYFSDEENNCVRQIAAGTGLIKTIAGSGVAGMGGDGGPASTAQLNHPTGICIDKNFNLYVADYYNHRVRKISLGNCDGASSSDELARFADKEISIFPCPVSNFVEISCVSEQIKIVSICNIAGQVVVQHAGSGKQQQQVDVSTLPPGMYIVRVNEVWTARLVKE